MRLSTRHASVFLASLVGAALVCAIMTRAAESHDTGLFPLMRQNPYRVPWDAGDQWRVADGWGPGEGSTHAGCNGCIDFSQSLAGSQNDIQLRPIKAIGHGTLDQIDGDPLIGLGKHVYVNRPGGVYSVYGHMCGFGAPEGSIVQGEWIGNVGNTGYVLPNPGSVRCQGDFPTAHLHLVVGDSSGTYNAILSGESLTHFAQERWTYHASNNSGGGYYDAVSREVGIQFRQLSEEPASTRRSGVTICDASSSTATYYVRDCDDITFQEFVRPAISSNSSYHVAYAIVESPSFLYWHKVEGEFLKAYSARLYVNGPKVAGMLGRPVGEEGTCYQGARCQVFEHGSIWRTGGQPGYLPGWTMTVLDEHASVVFSRPFTEYSLTGECLSIDGNRSVGAADLGLIANPVYWGGDDGEYGYDPLVDVSGLPGVPLGNAVGDGKINVADLGFAANNTFPNYGACRPEL